MRVAGNLSLDGTTIALKQGGNSTTITAGAPAGDIAVTLPATADTLVGKATTDTLTNKSIDADTNTITNIENADIKAAAAIAVNKLAATTASRVLVSDGSGFIAAADVTSAELAFLDGVTTPTGSGALVLGTAPSITSATLTTPIVAAGSTLTLNDQASIRFEDDTGDQYVQIQAKAGTTTHTLNLPTAQGGVSEVLGNDGSGNLSWMAALTDALNDNHLFIGDATNSSTAVDTATVGDILADTVTGMTIKSGTVIASPVLTAPQINDTSSDHQYIVAVNELEADRTVTLPLLAGNDEFVFKDHAVTLTNKTLTAPVISTISNSGTLTLPTSTDTLVGRATEDTLTNKRLTSPIVDGVGLILVDTSDDDVYVIVPGELTQDTNISLPNLASDDEFVFKDHAVTLTNKTISAGRYTSSAQADSYIVLDDDGFSVIRVTAGASDKTITLPTASANVDREITIKKVDSGAGRVLIVPEGSETLDGFTSVKVPLQNDFITVQSNGSNWIILNRKELTQWVAYTPTGNWTNTTFQGLWRRSGDSIEFRLRAGCTGTPDAAPFTISLPANTTIDSTKLSNSIGSAADIVGYAYTTDSGTAANRKSGRVFPASTTVLSIISDAASTVSNTSPFTFTTNDQVMLIGVVPIVEFGDT